MRRLCREPSTRIDQMFVIRQTALRFRLRIVGQGEASRAVAYLILRLKSGLNGPNRPIGVPLVRGPTVRGLNIDDGGFEVVECSEAQRSQGDWEVCGKFDGAANRPAYWGYTMTIQKK